MPGSGTSNASGKFQAKNRIYLRISKRCVLMTKILIDPPHLSWYHENSAMILSKLTEILRPRIRRKLLDENDASNKKSKLDIYRDSCFRFGYYFRNLTYQHTILLKSREVIHPIQSERFASEQDGAESNDEDIKPDLSSSLKVHYEPFSIFGKSLVVMWCDTGLRPSSFIRIEPYPLPDPSPTENTSPSTLSTSAKPIHPRPQAPHSEKPLFIPDDDEDNEELPEDLILGLNRSRQTLLSQLIKDPTSDRQLDHKSQPQSRRLDDFLVPDPPSKNSSAS
ncbi:hypothetical protein VP01_2380g2 [Puccinia sorghi]|uniref:Uncharacterized protein n=1 Tax=Puccinia sorghi TaxID=27349 RepID=A0A0L6V7N1_9BASI|nr:hypothetical protein VP01_2380g2 [Puccinia sorghi]